MKVNITTDGTQLNGYLNTDSPTLEQVSHSEATEILAPHIINAIPFQDLGTLFEIFLSKLRKGGIIKIGGYDAIELGRGMLFETVSTVERNSLIGMSRCFMTLEEVVEVMEHVGFKIKKKKLDGLYYLIEAERE